MKSLIYFLLPKNRDRLLKNLYDCIVLNMIGYSLSTFCLDAKGGAKKSRQKIMLRIFCRASAREHPDFLKFSLMIEVIGRRACAMLFENTGGAVFFAGI